MNYATEFARKTCLETVKDLSIITDGIFLNGSEGRNFNKIDNESTKINLMDVEFVISEAKSGEQVPCVEAFVVSIHIKSEGETYSMEVVCLNKWYISMFTNKISEKMMNATKFFSLWKNIPTITQDSGSNQTEYAAPSVAEIQAIQDNVYMNEWEKEFMIRWAEEHREDYVPVVGDRPKSRIERIYEGVAKNDFLSKGDYSEAISDSRTISETLDKMREAKRFKDAYNLP